MNNNWIHSLYPSTKALFWLSIILLSMFVPGYTFQYLMLPLIMIVSMMSGDFKKVMELFLKFILIIVVFIFAIQTFIVSYGDEVQIWKFIHFSQTGLNTSLDMTSKIVAISAATIWFFRVTSVKDIIYGLEKARIPKKVTFVISSTIQMIPQATMLQHTIADAQKSRGIETDGNFWIRIKAFIPMIGPLVLSLIQQTEERVLALESKGFSAGARKTSVYEIKKTAADYILDSLFIIVVVGYFVGRAVL